MCVTSGGLASLFDSLKAINVDCCSISRLTKNQQYFLRRGLLGKVIVVCDVSILYLRCLWKLLYCVWLKYRFMIDSSKAMGSWTLKALLPCHEMTSVKPCHVASSKTLWSFHGKAASPLLVVGDSNLLEPLMLSLRQLL